MALQAACLLVGTRQRPIGFRAMVEARLLPASGRVAITALLAIAARMNIGAAMTVHAFSRQGFASQAIEMTALASLLLMRSGEGKVGFRGVVEGESLPVLL